MLEEERRSEKSREETARGGRAEMVDTCRTEFRKTALGF
jgi:hypothetical protein